MMLSGHLEGKSKCYSFPLVTLVCCFFLFLGVAVLFLSVVAASGSKAVRVFLCVFSLGAMFPFVVGSVALEKQILSMDAV